MVPKYPRNGLHHTLGGRGGRDMFEFVRNEREGEEVEGGEEDDLGARARRGPGGHEDEGDGHGHEDEAGGCRLGGRGSCVCADATAGR